MFPIGDLEMTSDSAAGPDAGFTRLSRRVAVTLHLLTSPRGELADRMVVSERTVKRWVALGMPSETWGMARTRRFLPFHRGRPRGAPTPGAMASERDLGRSFIIAPAGGV